MIIKEKNVSALVDDSIIKSEINKFIERGLCALYDATVTVRRWLFLFSMPRLINVRTTVAAELHRKSA